MQGPDRFYPPGLKQAEFLRYYSRRYDTVELDGTWYRLPSEKTVNEWIALTPDGFIFAPKIHRQITHRWRLKTECFEFLPVVLDRLAPLSKAGRLGPFLIQLPPNFVRDDDRLGRFLERLPPSGRWAVEFRHDTWSDEQVESLLRRFNASWVAADTDERPAECRDTADFWYVRLRRAVYGDDALTQWAERIRERLKKGTDCYVFCKHEDEGSPWLWADRLVQSLA
ncbi:MAG TPA: DUF72 domain-containing protein [Nitrospira sp.]|nr:DUF72 domain-containing protein [Nitrospira sp.]